MKEKSICYCLNGFGSSWEWKKRVRRHLKRVMNSIREGRERLGRDENNGAYTPQKGGGGGHRRNRLYGFGTCHKPDVLLEAESGGETRKKWGKITVNKYTRKNTNDL